MIPPQPCDEFTVRFPSPSSEPGMPAEIQVRGIVDHESKTITYDLPDGTRATLDVVTARALQMILWEAVFGCLRPTGPRLEVERGYAGDWPAVLSAGDARLSTQDMR